MRLRRKEGGGEGRNYYLKLLTIDSVARASLNASAAAAEASTFLCMASCIKVMCENSNFCLQSLINV
jgi:hypothetical protein